MNPFLSQFGAPTSIESKGHSKNTKPAKKKTKDKVLNPNNDTLAALKRSGIKRSESDQLTDPASLFLSAKPGKNAKLGCCNNSTNFSTFIKKAKRKKKQSIGDILINVVNDDSSDSESNHEITPLYYLPAKTTSSCRHIRQSNGPIVLNNSTSPSQTSLSQPNPAQTYNSDSVIPDPNGLLADDIYNKLSDTIDYDPPSKPSAPQSETIGDFYQISADLMDDLQHPTTAAENHFTYQHEMSDDSTITEAVSNSCLFDASYLDSIAIPTVDSSLPAPVNTVSTEVVPPQPLKDLAITNQELPEWDIHWDNDESIQEQDGFTF